MAVWRMKQSLGSGRPLRRFQWLARWDEGLNSNSCGEQPMASIYNRMVEIKGFGSNLELERKRREGMDE